MSYDETRPLFKKRARTGRGGRVTSLYSIEHDNEGASSVALDELVFLRHSHKKPGGLDVDSLNHGTLKDRDEPPSSYVAPQTEGRAARLVNQSNFQGESYSENTDVRMYVCILFDIIVLTYQERVCGAPNGASSFWSFHFG